MIECVFTIDYEIYGNGKGSLMEHVYEPAEKLKAIFEKWNARFVAFVEVAELEMIEAQGSDPAIDLVKNQIRDFYKEGFELGLHLHPQWYNGKYANGMWYLDYREYNICKLPHDRIANIVDRSIGYFRKVLDIADYTPISFRAGNWLFQPTQTVANVLAERGIKVDSSVFKGGLQHQHKLDYRPAMKNGYYWKFTDDVNMPVPQGIMLELPIHTQTVRPWKMATSKRVGLQQKAFSIAQSRKSKLYRLLDFLRLQYPLKLDFCRMTLAELTGMIDSEILRDDNNTTSYRPLVAIGHTKDLVDFETVESFLSYLKQKGIAVGTLEEAYDKIKIHYEL
jgi:hypothetical protein